jgi:hypothetical protein
VGERTAETETNFVNWQADWLNKEILAKALTHFAPFFENLHFRKEVLRRLKIPYWWEKVQMKVDLMKKIYPNLSFPQ